MKKKKAKTEREIYYVRNKLPLTLPCRWCFFRRWRKQDGKKLKLPCRERCHLSDKPRMRFFFSSNRKQQQRWQIKFMILEEGCDEEKVSEWVRARTRATTQEYGWEKKEKGFWQIDCQAETEMAQEHHKNKFAIIHFDLSLGKIGNCYGERQTVECVSRRRWVEAKFTFLFFFLLLSFRKKCFVSCLFFLCEANITE